LGTDRCIPFFIVLLMCFWRVCDVPLISHVSVSADSFCYGIRLLANRFLGSELMIVICGYDRAIPAPSAIRVMSSSFILPFASFFPRI
jgi:hypothetical protein